jgi:hypothetical protein
MNLPDACSFEIGDVMSHMVVDTYIYCTDYEIACLQTKILASDYGTWSSDPEVLSYRRARKTNGLPFLPIPSPQPCFSIMKLSINNLLAFGFAIAFTSRQNAVGGQVVGISINTDQSEILTILNR